MPRLKKTGISKGNLPRPRWSVTCYKSSSLLLEIIKMKDEFIENNPEHPIAKWPRILQIERTGYYELEEGCIFHSDRGRQFTSHAVMDLLKQ